MAQKQKRNIPEAPEKKSKKRKKASSKESLIDLPGTPDATLGAAAATTAPDRKELPPESGAVGSEVLAPAEQRALERKQKKERRKEEKRLLREAGGHPAPKTPAPAPSGGSLALDYLCSWAQKQQDWKFRKARQTWLLVHMYDSDKVPDEHFPTLLAYLEGLKGQARELTVQKAEARMLALDEAGTTGQDPQLLGQAHRIRQVLQLLS
ncbi:protein cholesin isoform X2 [Tenrec ecaudatus]